MKSIKDMAYWVFDEIQLRSSFAVNVNKMSYHGIVDFGDETLDQVDQKEQYNKQSVAIYRVKGTTKGCILAKLTVQVIQKLQQSHCHLDRIVAYVFLCQAK